MWTRESVIAKLQTSDILVERSLLKLYARQTTDEQASLTTKHTNGMGFNGVDSFILTSFSQWILKLQDSGRPEGKRLSDKQRAIARKKLVKYVGQLMEDVM